VCYNLVSGAAAQATPVSLTAAFEILQAGQLRVC